MTESLGWGFSCSEKKVFGKHASIVLVQRSKKEQYEISADTLVLRVRLSIMNVLGFTLFFFFLIDVLLCAAV